MENLNNSNINIKTLKSGIWDVVISKNLRNLGLVTIGAFNIYASYLTIGESINKSNIDKINTDAKAEIKKIRFEQKKFKMNWIV